METEVCFFSLVEKVCQVLTTSFSVILLPLCPASLMHKNPQIPYFARIDAAALISFFMIQLRRLFEGGVYSGAAFIPKPLYSVLNTVLYIVSFH